MNTRDNYEPHNWTLVHLPLEHDFSDTTRVSLLTDSTCGVDSEQAKKMDESREPFYYDVEQVYAGLDAVYGVWDLREATQDFSLPDGTVVTSGALVFSIHSLDFKTKTRAVLVESV